MLFKWKLPNNDFNSIELNYKILENSLISKNFSLNKTSNSFFLNELIPGSTVLLNLTLISNKTSSCESKLTTARTCMLKFF